MTALRRLILGATAAVLLVAAAAPAAASARTQTAHAGNVSATFTFKGSFPNFSHQSLTITRNGMTVYSKPVTAHFCGKFCGPGAPERNASSVHVLDLEGNGQLEVVLDLFSGGAHCCTIEQVFSYQSATNTYVKTEHNFGDPGDRLRDLDHNGKLEFVTADDSFAYKFSSFATSGLPVQILAFSGSHFTNVTRNYPKLITADAALWLRLFKHNLNEGVGLIAAWAADEDLLGHFSLVKSTLATELHNGDLRGAQISGSKFVAALQKFLRAHGYVR